MCTSDRVYSDDDKFGEAKSVISDSGVSMISQLHQHSRRNSYLSGGETDLDLGNETEASEGGQPQEGERKAKRGQRKRKRAKVRTMNMCCVYAAMCN